ncbi:MAG: hypothetical protein PQ612_06045 [Rickettsiales bacterium]|nr:hypothetical protein [Pseudomonadota bacterium]MDA0966885.1 hypothetical protein [Pseudomonadota bacterium]MDG4543560.1 hypothetical protein [Rickettsiales bacterium]MDG4545708.1 hypothetical protein [Rickettsiales bacterium]MDG4547519.1 hypothetical protein [Rickettsiales bacterium]
MKITLAGEEIELNPTFENIKKAESEMGTFVGYGTRCVKETVTVSDIVNAYYHLQSTPYSKPQLFEKITNDGLIKHMINLRNLIVPLLTGKEPEEYEKEVEGQAEKK